MTSPSGWREPGQTPEFDEYTVVLRGELQIETREMVYNVVAGRKERSTSRSVFRPFHCKPCTATRNSFLPAESKEAGHKKDSNHGEGQRDFDGGAEDEADCGAESGARRLAETALGQ